MSKDLPETHPALAATCSVCAVGLMVMARATTFWLCALLLFAVGFAATSQMAATNTIVQRRSPDALRSRLMAVYATMFMGVQPIGALIAGGVAKRIGTPDTLLLFGALVLAACVIFIFQVVMKVGVEPLSQVLDFAADKFAEARRGPEASEGLRAFAEKRPPKWAVE